MSDDKITNGGLNSVSEIKEAIAKYADYQHAIAVENMARDAAKDEILTPEMKVKIANLEDEYSGRTKVAEEKCEQLKAEIAASMLKLPESEFQTLRADGFMAVAKGGKRAVVLNPSILLAGLKNLQNKYPALASEIADVISMANEEQTTARSVALQVERKK